jgi:chromosome segregation ATPase
MTAEKLRKNNIAKNKYKPGRSFFLPQKYEIKPIFFSFQLRNNEFGRTLLGTIQLELKLGEGAVAQIIRLLEEMRSNIQAAQKSADDTYAAQQESCSSQKSTLESEIKSANEQILANDAQKLKNQQEIQAKRASLEDDKKTLEEKRNILNSLIQQRKNEREAFESSTADNNDAISKLRKGREIFIKLQINGEATPTLFAEVTSKMQEIKTSHYKGFVKIITNLLQNQQVKADQKLVKKVLDLIDELISVLEADNSRLMKAEVNNQDAFDTAKNNLDTEISTLETTISNNEDRVKELLAANDKLVEHNAELSTRVDNKTQELKQLNKTCSDYDAAYNSSTSER